MESIHDRVLSHHIGDSRSEVSWSSALPQQARSMAFVSNSKLIRPLDAWSADHLSKDGRAEPADLRVGRHHCKTIARQLLHSPNASMGCKEKRMRWAAGLTHVECHTRPDGRPEAVGSSHMALWLVYQHSVPSMESVEYAIHTPYTILLFTPRLNSVPSLSLGSILSFSTF